MVEKLLGKPFELDPFVAWAAGQPVLDRDRARGSRASGRRSARMPFESLVTSITAQQVSLRAAVAIRNRMIERYGERGVHAFAFPTRERIAAASEDELVAVGFSRRKAEYVIGLARAELDLDGLLPARRRRDPGAGSPRSAGSAPGRPSGSSPATSPGRGPGPSATSRCARPSISSTVVM